MGPLKTHLTLIMYVITTSLPQICELDKRTQERHLRWKRRARNIANVMRVNVRGENVRRTQMGGTNIHVPL